MTISAHGFRIGFVVTTVTGDGISNQFTNSSGHDMVRVTNFGADTISTASSN